MRLDAAVEIRVTLRDGRSMVAMITDTELEQVHSIEEQVADAARILTAEMVKAKPLERQGDYSVSIC